MKKIHAVIQLFDNFATRTMAYDFHHIIALVKFDSTVKTLHTFTETLEKFKVKLTNNTCLNPETFDVCWVSEGMPGHSDPACRATVSPQ